MNRANYLILALLALVISGLAYVGADKPHFSACVKVTIDGRDHLFVGNPGAGANAQPTTCKLEFVTASGSSYVRYTQGKLSSTDQLKPLENIENVAGADAIASSGGNTVRCHLVRGQLVPGGNQACSFGLWQLIPYSDGVALRLKRGDNVSAYTLVPARAPQHGAHPVHW